MKILMITTTYPRFEGDTAAPFIASIAEGIQSLGNSVHMVLPFHPDLSEEERNGVHLYPYRVPGDEREQLWGYAGSLDADIKLKRKVLYLAPFAMHSAYQKASEIGAVSKPDLVHSHWALPNGFVGMHLARKLRCPLVVSLHGSDMFLARRNSVFRRFAAAVLKSAAAVTACSPDLQEQAEEMSGRSVTLMEYGVDTRHFNPGPVRPAGPLSVLAVGRLVHKKGFLPLLDAFAKIHTYYNDSTLTIAGAGPLMGQLKERAGLLGVARFVHFLGDVERQNLPSLFRSATVVTVPSITDEFGNRDGLPNVLLEAMACGSAIVASDIPGIQNVLQDRANGWIVPEGNIDALAEGIRTLLGDRELCASLGRNARLKVETELSWEVKCNQLQNIYEKILPGGSRVEDRG